MTGLQLHFDGCWAISARQWDAEVAFAALPIICPDGCYLYFEGGLHASEVAAFIEANQVEPAAKIYPGAIWPKQQTYHVPATASVFGALSRLAHDHAAPEICDHLIVYQPSLVLVDWYDAFDREIYASSTIPEGRIREFSELANASYRVEAT
jgi:hypothetical protein